MWREAVTNSIQWARVILLYQTQLRHNKASAPTAVANKGIRDTNNDIDELSAVRRDDGGLSEPLQDSVLLYGLNGLRRTVRTEGASPSISDLQSSIMQSTNDNTPHSHFPSPAQPHLQTFQAAEFSFANDLAGDFLSAEGFDLSDLNTASGDLTNWNWHLDIFDQNAGLDDIMNTL